MGSWASTTTADRDRIRDTTSRSRAPTRAGELQRAAIVAGFSRVATLGYDDSGMKGWAQNDGPNAFMNADVDARGANAGRDHG